MFVYRAVVKLVWLRLDDDHPPGLHLKLEWAVGRPARAVYGYDDLDINIHGLAKVASALSGAANVDNHILIANEPVVLEVDKRRYLSAIVFERTGKRVDFKNLFRYSRQADGELPR